MTKFARIIDVLDLYSEDVAFLTAEEVAALLQVSRPTAFRYMRELTAAGFLANYSGRYSLGARIITLDYRIRASDPVLNASRDVMRSLCDETRCSAVLCRMYNDEIIHVHAESAFEDGSFALIGRGRSLPLFRGAASKMMLASLPPARLKKLYERHRNDEDLRRLTPDWNSFKAYYEAIREAGHYVSDQEIEVGKVGIAAPVSVPQVGPVAVVSLVFAAERQAVLNTDGLARLLKDRMRQVADRLHLLSGGAEPEVRPRSRAAAA